MCKNTTLYYNDENGYLIHCDQCDSIQLGFGCILVNFSREDFGIFVRMIDEIIDNNNFVYTSRVKSIMIPSPCDSLSLCLSPEEIHRLHGMLEHADTQLKVRDLIQLF